MSFDSRCAIVELKYVEKGIYIVPNGNIQSSKPKPSAVDPYFCFLSANITDDPDFDAKYSEKFDGSPGVFKVFIRRITKTYDEAVRFLKEKRMQTVPKKYRQPSNTDAELKAADDKKKKVQKQLLKVNKAKASTKNSAYLAELLSAADSGSSTIASKFEDLVKKTLEESSNSDTEDDSSVESVSNENSENHTFSHQSNVQENLEEIDEMRCTSSPISVVEDRLDQNLTSRKSNENEQSKKCEGKNQINIKPDQKATVKKRTTTNAPATPVPRKLGINEINNISSTQTIHSSADGQKLSGISGKQSVMFTVNDKNPIKATSSETSSSSKVKQIKRKMNTVGEASKSKISLIDSPAAISTSTANNSRSQTKMKVPVQSATVVSEVINDQTMMSTVDDRNPMKAASCEILSGSKGIKRKMNTVGEASKSKISLIDSSVAISTSAVNNSRSQTKINLPVQSTSVVSEVINDQTVMFTVDDKNLMKAASCETLSGSKEKQIKRKINVDEAQKSKASLIDSSAAISTSTANNSRSETNINLPVQNSTFVCNEKETLENEILNLKRENEVIKERNIALQSALVSASRSGAQVSFEEEIDNIQHKIHQRMTNLFISIFIMCFLYGNLQKL